MRDANICLQKLQNRHMKKVKAVADGAHKTQGLE